MDINMVLSLRSEHVKDTIDQMEDDINDKLLLIKYKTDRLRQFISSRLEGDGFSDNELLMALGEIEIQQQSIAKDRQKLNSMLHNVFALEAVMELLSQ